MDDSPARILRFGDFELDRRAGELRKHGVKIRLQEQSLQILLMLLDRPGEVVLRDEIRAKLWPSDTVVEFDHSINAAIKRLRNALGESADAPRLVETLAKRGYRFIGDTVKDPKNQEPPAQRQWLPWTIAVLTIGVAVAIAGSAWLGPKPVQLGTVRFPLPLPEGTTHAMFGAAPEAVPSPDGRRVAFVAVDRSTGKSNLWVRPLALPTAQKLDKTEGANFPFWSPDAQFIAYFSENKLKRVAVSGGPPQTICEVPTPAPLAFGSNGTGGAWNRDGVIVFGSTGTALMRVPAIGGMPVPVTALETGETRHSWPLFAPDGRHLLYFARNRDAAKTGIYVQELGSSKRVLVLKNAVRGAWASPGYLLFVRESILFAQHMNPKTFELEGKPVSTDDQLFFNENNGWANFAISENGVLVYRRAELSGDVSAILTWYDRNGKRLGSVGNPGGYVSISLSPDEKTAATVVTDSGRRCCDTSIVDLASGVLTRLTLDSQSSYRFGPWSPDGRRLAVNLGAEHAVEGIRELTVSSGTARDVVRGSFYAADWSPDSNSLLCIDRDDQRVAVLPLTAANTARTILDSRYHKRAFRFGPGGQWVSYSSDESGRFEVFIAMYPSFNEKRQVSNGGGDWPLWRKDGREIFYVAADQSLMSAEVRTGARLEVGTPKPLFRLPPRGRSYGNMVAPVADGTRFLVIETAEQKRQAEVQVVLNFLEDLKKRVQ